jgi:hypothetical protein
MKKSTLFLLALLGHAILTVHNVQAGSAVATDGLGHNIYTCGHPVELAKKSVLELARRNGWHARIIASSDVTGYGAIAIALDPSGHGSLIGVALGRRSATEADTLAVELCAKAGGINPKVRWGFRG